MKKLILTIGICALGLAGFAATDAEIKEMLAKKDYTSAVVNISRTQLTNGVVTAADINGLVDASIKTNAKWDVVFLAKYNAIDPIETIALFEKARNPEFMMIIASNTKNEDIMANTLAKVLDMPETTGKILYDYRGTPEFRDANFELFKRSAEKILKEYPQAYVHYVFNYRFKHPEYRDWSMSCIKNIKENMFDINTWSWFNLYCYDINIAKTGFSRTDEFYFEKAFTKITNNNVDTIYRVVHRCEFKDKAIETMAKSITNADVAFKFSKLVDKKEENKEMTERMFSVISKDIKFGIDAALYLNDNDKIIDILLTANDKLTAENIDKVIPVINSLDVDYRKDDIVKALRNINARYTLKLYNDRKTWEPILSKIRALIDVRQM
jgi:hypothetical protein